MRTALIIFWIVGLINCKQDCSNPVISLTTVASESESAFLLWETDSSCPYTYDVWWYPGEDENAAEHERLDTDDSKITLRNLTPNTKYTILISTNASQSNTTEIIYTAPDAVANLTVTATTLYSVTLSWDSPADGSGKDTWSKVCALGGDATPQCDVINDQVYKFTGLAYCTTYSFTVTSLGYTPPSSTEPLKSTNATIKHQTSKHVPGQARLVEVSALNSYTILAAWLPPIWYDAPECVTGYNVSIYNSSYSTSLLTKPDTVYTRFSDLEPCTTYNISVVTIGEEGEVSHVVADASIKTAPSPVPRKEVFMNNSGPTWVEFSWDIPTFGSECLAGYTVYGRAEDFGSWTFLKNFSSTDDLSYNLTGLEPCESRTINILAVNEVGTVSESLDYYVESAGEDPGNITDLTAEVKPSDFSIYLYDVHLKWNPPSTTSKCLALFQVCYIDEDFPHCSYSDYNDSYTLYSVETCTNFTYTVTIIGPHLIEFGTWFTTASVPYVSQAILSDLSLYDYYGNATHVYWRMVSGVGTDCIQYFNVCWSVKSSSDCKQTVLKYMNVPVEKSSILQINVTAVFYDGESSKPLSLHQSGSTNLKVSPVFILVTLVLICIQKIGICN